MVYLSYEELVGNSETTTPYLDFNKFSWRLEKETKTSWKVARVTGSPHDVHLRSRMHICALHVLSKNRFARARTSDVRWADHGRVAVPNTTDRQTGWLPVRCSMSCEVCCSCCSGSTFIHLKRWVRYFSSRQLYLSLGNFRFVSGGLQNPGEQNCLICIEV